MINALPLAAKLEPALCVFYQFQGAVLLCSAKVCKASGLQASLYIGIFKKAFCSVCLLASRLPGVHFAWRINRYRSISSLHKPALVVQVPLVEQETADKGSEPILAMKHFRLGKHLGFDKFGKYAETPIYRGGAVNSTTFFGWDAVPVQLGSVISVGDKVTVK